MLTKNLKDVLILIFKMRVAVLFTGALRTIKKTIRYHNQNIFSNPNVHIFACLQNDTNEPNEQWDQWFHQQIGDKLKTIEWCNINNSQEFITNRERLINNLTIPDMWKNYLKTSGSIIEYIQLQYAYIKMDYYEQTNGFVYDYIIRLRTDTIFAKPIDFHWLQWTDQEVALRVENIKKELQDSKIEPSEHNLVRYFMSTIISDEIIPNIQNISADYWPNRDQTIPSIKELNQYIKNSSYILVFRANNLYIVRRNLFYLIPAIGACYGYLHYPLEDDYWFNAENQFRGACYNSNITIYDYCTTFEEKSLYEYDEQRYFDLDYNVLNPYMLFCLVRN
jgi:hypothetical protein